MATSVVVRNTGSESRTAAHRSRVAPEVSAADREPITVGGDGELCRACRGHGLVRGVGKRAGGPYRTSNGAQQALAAGRAKDCAACEGTGVAVGAPF